MACISIIEYILTYEKDMIQRVCPVPLCRKTANIVILANGIDHSNEIIHVTHFRIH